MLDAKYRNPLSPQLLAAAFETMFKVLDASNSLVMGDALKLGMNLVVLPIGAKMHPRCRCQDESRLAMLPRNFSLGRAYADRIFRMFDRCNVCLEDCVSMSERYKHITQRSTALKVSNRSNQVGEDHGHDNTA